MRKMLLVALGVVLVVADIVSVSAQTTDPRMGTWKLNVAKSQFSPGPPPQSLTVKVEGRHRSTSSPRLLDSRQPSTTEVLMRLIGLVVVLALTALAPLAADGQDTSKIPKIGFLSPGFAIATAPLFEAFKQGLREQGYIEGQNIAIEGPRSTSRP